MNLWSRVPACTPLVRRVAAIGLGVAAWGVWRVLAARPDLAERLVGGAPLAELPRLWSLVTGVVPFAIAELLVLALLLGYGAGLVLLIRKVRAGRLSAGQAFGRGALRLGADAGVLLAVFYLLWGFQYARPGLEERLGLPERGAATVAEVAQMAGVLVLRTNQLYREVGPGTRVADQIPGLEHGWRVVQERYGLDDRLVRPHGPPRSFLFLPVMRQFRIAGVHVPWTGEALVMGDLPPSALPKAVAHEMAHQRGVAREADANTLGYLVAAASPDPAHRYAAALFLQRQYLAELSRRSPETAAALVGRRLPGVQDDVDELIAYWERADGVVGRATRRANDAMLRSHGVEGGVSDYGGSLWATLALARRDGVESVLPSVF